MAKVSGRGRMSAFYSQCWVRLAAQHRFEPVPGAAQRRGYPAVIAGNATTLKELIGPYCSPMKPPVPAGAAPDAAPGAGRSVLAQPVTF
jgi:hypothetical protein